MKKKIISLLLALAMALSLVACGGGNNTPASSGGDAAETEVSSSGKVLNIYVWNQEFQGLFNSYYTGVGVTQTATLKPLPTRPSPI